MSKKNDIKPKVKARTTSLENNRVQILFKKGLTSEQKVNLISLQTLLHLELGHDVTIVSSANAGEIIGLVGEKKYIDDILKYHIIEEEIV